MHIITDFGALGDGESINTLAIQTAIDHCAASGGGRVLVPPGLFYTGTLWLRDNIELYLCRGAVLKGSANLDDYNRDDAFEQNLRSEQEQWNGSHLLLAVEVSNVSISGPGCIDGNCEAFFEPEPRAQKPRFIWSHGMRLAKDKLRLRPGQMIMFSECTNIRVQDLELRNSSCWSCLFHGCQDVYVSGLKISNPIDGGNTDGIDIDCCRRVIVRDCNISTGDDAITLRGSYRALKDKSGICEDIVICNCIIDSSVCAFRIGVGEGRIRNASISNIVIRRAGVGFLLQSAYNARAPRGVDISEISISNIQARNLAFPLRIISGHPSATAQISQVRVTGYHGQCHGNCTLRGNAQTRPHDIRLSNFNFTVVAPPAEYASTQEQPKCFLELDQVDQISLDNFNIRWRQQSPAWEVAMQQNDCTAVYINSNCNLSPPKKAPGIKEAVQAPIL